MTTDTLACIALGSNIDPEHRITRALAALRALPHSTLIAESSWYRTAPWGIEAQPDFINLAVLLRTRVSARELLAQTQAIEQSLGRMRTLRNGPRTIDLDILLYGEQLIDEPDLRIPHPALTWRDFMLVPLMEIAPDLVHPERAQPLKALTGELRYCQIIERHTSAQPDLRTSGEALVSG